MDRPDNVVGCTGRAAKSGTGRGDATQSGIIESTNFGRALGYR